MNREGQTASAQSLAIYEFENPGIMKRLEILQLNAKTFRVDAVVDLSLKSISAVFSTKSILMNLTDNIDGAFYIFENNINIFVENYKYLLKCSEAYKYKLCLDKDMKRYESYISFVFGKPVGVFKMICGFYIAEELKVVFIPVLVLGCLSWLLPIAFWLYKYGQHTRLLNQRKAQILHFEGLSLSAQNFIFRKISNEKPNPGFYSILQPSLLRKLDLLEYRWGDITAMYTQASNRLSDESLKGKLQLFFDEGMVSQLNGFRIFRGQSELFFRHRNEFHLAVSSGDDVRLSKFEYGFSTGLACREQLSEYSDIATRLSQLKEDSPELFEASKEFIQALETYFLSFEKELGLFVYTVDQAYAGMSKFAKAERVTVHYRNAAKIAWETLPKSLVVMFYFLKLWLGKKNEWAKYPFYILAAVALLNFILAVFLSWKIKRVDRSEHNKDRVSFDLLY